MLSNEAKIVLDFIEECRSQLMMKDEFHQVSEKMFSKLYEIEEFLKTTDEGKKLFTEFEDLVFQTINKAKETYFEYGENYSTVSENNFMEKLNEEAM